MWLQVPIIVNTSGVETRIFQYSWATVCIAHYVDVIMGVMVSHTPASQPLFRCISKKISKLCITGLCAGNSPVTGEFPTQMASNVENVAIWWCHHASHKFSIRGVDAHITHYPGKYQRVILTSFPLYVSPSLTGVDINDNFTIISTQYIYLGLFWWVSARKMKL